MYIWSQLSNSLVRSKMFKPNAKMVEDSDNAMDEDDLILSAKNEDEYEI